MNKKSAIATALSIPIGAIIGALKAQPGHRWAGASYGGTHGALTGLGADLAGIGSYYASEGLPPESRLGTVAGGGVLGGYGGHKLADLVLPYLYEKGELEEIFGK